MRISFRAVGVNPTNIATARCFVIRFRNVTLNLSTRFATVSFEIRSEHSWKPIKGRIAWVDGPGSAKAALFTALARPVCRSFVTDPERGLLRPGPDDGTDRIMQLICLSPL